MNADPRKNPGIKRPYLPLPSVIAPAGETCITIPVPDHPDHRRALMSVLHLLESWHAWERTGTNDGAQAAAVWREKLERINWDGGNCENEFEQDCVDFSPSASFITYAPQNPYTEPDYIPDGYLGAPFTIVESGDTYNTFQYLEVGDIVCKAPPITAGFDYPRFRVTVYGEREIELHLLTLFTGGSVLVTQDDDPLSVEVVDLYRDQTAVPPESAVEIVIERQVVGAGEHHIDVTFVPLVDTELTPIGFGGGLRKVTICGEEDMAFDVRQSPDNPLILEKSSDGETWVTFAELLPQSRVRQTIVTPCVPEQSFDDGETWNPVMDLQLCPPRIRWRGGIPEYSVDGETWEPFEILDPLYDDPPPPVDRPEDPADQRCSSATSAAAAYLELASRLYTILSNPFALAPIPVGVAASFAGAAADVLNFFSSSDIFGNIAANIAFQSNVIGYVIGLYADAVSNTVTPDAQLVNSLGLTDPDTRERLKCAFYCITGSGGVIPSDQVADALNTAIADNGLASGWTSFVALFGAGGVFAASQIGSVTAAASECEDCDCPTELCFVPSDANMIQTECTSSINHLYFDGGGAYTNVGVGMGGQAANLLDLNDLFPLPEGAIGWRVKITWTVSMELLEYATSMNYVPEGAPCAFGRVPMTVTSDIWQSVPEDHPWVWMAWNGDAGAGRVSEVCIEPEF